MAVGKQGGRQGQDKKVPSFFLMVTTVIFVAFCLIAIWAFSAPSEPSSEISENTAPTNDKARSRKKPTNMDQLEDITSLDIQAEEAEEELEDLFESEPTSLTQKVEKSGKPSTHSPNPIKESTLNEDEDEQEEVPKKMKRPPIKALKPVIDPELEEDRKEKFSTDWVTQLMESRDQKKVVELKIGTTLKDGLDGVEKEKMKKTQKQKEDENEIEEDEAPRKVKKTQKEKEKEESEIKEEEAQTKKEETEIEEEEAPRKLKKTQKEETDNEEEEAPRKVKKTKMVESEIEEEEAPIKLKKIQKEKEEESEIEEEEAPKKVKKNLQKKVKPLPEPETEPETETEPKTEPEPEPEPESELGSESEPELDVEMEVEKKDTSNFDEFPSGGAESEILVESKETSDGWGTQERESKDVKNLMHSDSESDSRKLDDVEDNNPSEEESPYEGRQKEKKDVIQLYTKPEKPKEEEQVESPMKTKPLAKSADNVLFSWKICKNKAGNDYIPCLDNQQALKSLRSTKHYEHRERHCPERAPKCLVPLPNGYRSPILWPQSRNEVWYNNVPHPGLASYKKDQNWVKKSGDRLIFPGGGTQFKLGVNRYIDYIEQSLTDIAWGKRSRVVLDVGCGVASFGGYLFDRDVVTISFAPKDEHEAQVQLALERGIPAISSVMGTQRLVFPSNVFDIVHCARCRVPWHIEGGKLLLELNRVLRPGGYFVWSATPVYWSNEEDVAIWKAMTSLTASICWKLVAKTVDKSTGIGAAVFQKPRSNSCYDNRKKDDPPICEKDDKADAAWYVPMTTCLHKIPSGNGAHGKEWPSRWPQRLETAPSWMTYSKGLYGKEGATDFQTNLEHWQRVIKRSYISGFGISWKKIRNVMDMRASYGGFAAALVEKKLWVMNVVPIDGPDTLPVIFDRGLIGVYHDWCESFSTYPRTYDLLHADHLFSKLQKRCNILPTIVEMDRILRPNGWAIFRDVTDTLSKIEAMIRSLHWEIRSTYNQDKEGILVAQKKFWRPEESS